MMKRSPGNSTNRPVELEARESGFAGQKLLAGEQGHLRDRLRGECVQMDASVLPQRFRRRQKVKLHAQPGDRREHLRRRQHHAASQFGGFHAGEVERGALTGDGFVGGLSMHLHPANAQPLASGMDFDFLLLADGPGDQRSGDHGSEAFHGEHTIDGQAKDRGGILRRDLGSEARELVLQPVESRAGLRAHRNDGSSRGIEEGAFEVLRDFHSHDFERLGINQVGFREHGDAALHREHAANIEVLAGLGLDGFVGRNHQQHQIDAADSRQHVAHKALVAGNVHETHANWLALRAGEIEVGEADVDGDAAPLLLFQAIRVGAGKRAHQGALAVVNVARGADDDGLHRNSVPNLSWNSSAPESESHNRLDICENGGRKLASGYRVYYVCSITKEVLYFRRVEGRLSG